LWGVGWLRGGGVGYTRMAGIPGLANIVFIKGTFTSTTFKQRKPGTITSPGTVAIGISIALTFYRTWKQEKCEKDSQKCKNL
jgi:hypothetical protein